MKGTPRRRLLAGAAIAVVLVVAGAVGWSMIGSDADSGEAADGGPSLSTAPVAQRDLAEYLEVSGTLDYEGASTLATRSSGVLMHLADEGTVIRQGEQLYLLVYEPTEEDTARVLAEVASARDAYSLASERLSEAVSGPSDAEIASAEASVAEAEDARERLDEPPTAAEISTAEAAVATAADDLATLEDPTPADLAAARAEIATAEAALADLRAGPSQADIDAAQAAVQTAAQALADLTAGPSEAEMSTAEAARLAAWERLRDELQHSDNDVEIDLARAELLTAEEHLADLQAGPAQAEIDDAEARVLTAEEALADLRAGPTQAEIDDAEARVLTARERWEQLDSPTEAQLTRARADLATAREALADLRAGPTQAEIDAADAAILSAEQALADLIAGPSADELAALEASLDSATAALLSAEADMAAHGEARRPLYAMHGETPAYRTMTDGLEGDDIRQLEANLAALGFGDADEFAVDGVFDRHTTSAVRRWQDRTGQNVDGEVSTADVLFIVGPVQVGSWDQGIEIGQELAAGMTLAALTVIETPEGGAMSTTQRVVADLPLSDRDLIAEGIAVNVELPDDTDVAGTVTVINPTPELDAQTGENIVEVTILLTEPASPVWIGATVTVEITETHVAGALVVPATALLALTEGGYAVEVLDDDGSTRLVGVETGLFVDGDVEVVSSGLAAGTRVVVPR